MKYDWTGNDRNMTFGRHISSMLIVKEKSSHFSFLQCSQCEKMYDPRRVNTVASCNQCDKNILLGVYEHLTGITPDDIDSDEQSLWRYFALLPVFDRKNIVSLGEGFTPILQLDKLGDLIGQKKLLLKDESLNPTGSFKARGMSVAISKAKELGITQCIVPTAGNAGGAMSAYCARAGIKALVVMPEHTPDIFKLECRNFGAEVITVKGLIQDCAVKVNEINRGGEYFDLSTLKEPYRLEGKKTMGFEIAEQLDWNLPDVILYPTGGGTGLIGMWRAFHEMIDMGWIPSRLPRMIAVQVDQCKPIVETWEGRQENCSRYVGQPTIANGLAVPRPFGERLIIEVLKSSGGTALAVSEQEIIASVKEVAGREGLLIAPEGAALWAAMKKLRATGKVNANESVLLLNTGSGHKYAENLN